MLDDNSVRAKELLAVLLVDEQIDLAGTLMVRRLFIGTVSNL